MHKIRTHINVSFTISQESFKQGWYMPYVHFHNDYEIYILKNGERIVSIENREYIVNAHDVTLFSANVPHKSKGTTPFNGICIHFSQWYLDFYFTHTAQKQLMKCFNHEVIRLSDDDFRQIQQLADDFILDAPHNFVYLSDILNILSNSTVQIDTPTLQAEIQSKTKQIISYVNENYTFIKTLSEIRDIFNISERYIFKIFREKYNTTPKQYINNLRIQHAIHRLTHSNETVKYIAASSGFDCYEYFLRVFKNKTGITPSKYRYEFSLLK